mmetsp:Transcript_5321/g.33393  ORF Transcript_5321/g.33393 Transcript_5321/m.33393 type:complete len:189 (+) Transcript_5321:461-1027(+)
MCDHQHETGGVLAPTAVPVQRTTTIVPQQHGGGPTIQTARCGTDTIAREREIGTKVERRGYVVARGRRKPCCGRAVHSLWVCKKKVRPKFPLPKAAPALQDSGSWRCKSIGSLGRHFTIWLAISGVGQLCTVASMVRALGVGPDTCLLCDPPHPPQVLPSTACRARRLAFVFLTTSIATITITITIHL